MTFVILGLAVFVAMTARRYGFEGVNPNCVPRGMPNPTVYSGSCSDVPTPCYNLPWPYYSKDIHQICTTVNSSSYSCVWPSWLPCGYCLGYFAFGMYFGVPDYERGTCVDKSGVSLWQFVGLIVGGIFCLSVWFVSVWRLKPATFWFFVWLVVYALLFGLIFGLGSSRIFPIPSGY